MANDHRSCEVKGSGRRASLNPAQQDAVQTSDNIVCCACPGSGKTHVLIEKVKFVLRNHPDPRILMTTFSRDAADEMLRRVKKDPSIDPQSLSRLVIGTFHSLALQQLRQAGKAGKVLSDLEAQHLIQRSLVELRSNIEPREADAVIARCKSDPAFAARNPDYAALTERYKHHLKDTGAQDFTDLLLHANELMATGVIKPIRATHVFGDEFQDIDQLQYDWLMHHLAQNPVACAVGDDDQAIYAFRRSLGHRGMMDFMAATGARIIHLSTNYRSTQGIVASASRLIEGNVDRVPKKITAIRGDGPPPTVVRIPKDGDQAMTIVHALDSICAGNEPPPTLPGRKPYRFGVAAKQAAVLARTNAQLADVERVFIRERVPFIRAGKGFWDAPALKVYLTLLTAVAKQEGMGFEIALSWARVPDSTVREIVANAGGSFWNLLRSDNPATARAKYSNEVTSLISCGRGWARKIDESNDANAADGIIGGVAQWMVDVMRKASHDDDGNILRDEGRRDIKDLVVLEAGRDALRAGEGSLRTRLQDIQRDKENKIPRVALATFHGSKGLEWENVFLLNVHSGSVPNITDESCEEELAEERRVMYVAMTRARDNLTIFARSDIEVSEFLIEAGLATPSNTATHQHELVFQ